MLKQTLITLLAITSLVASVQASAHQDNNRGHGARHWHQPQPKPVVPKFRINAAQARQAALINQGVQNRSLTRYEEKRLRDQQAGIARLEHRLRHAGLTKWERNTLKNQLIASRKLIKSYMNNHEHRKPRHHHHRGHNTHGNTTWNHSSRSGSFSISIGH